jgi:hypothetical protein
MDVTQIGTGGVDWIVLAQDKNTWLTLVKALINTVSQNAGNFFV